MRAETERDIATTDQPDDASLSLAPYRRSLDEMMARVEAAPPVPR